MGGARGQATDIEIQAEEILKVKKRINEIIAKNTGQKIEKVEKDTDRDFYMTSKEAKNYGIVDKIISRRG
jgi:ATP-dependent Clp protease protease subunit